MIIGNCYVLLLFFKKKETILTHFKKSTIITSLTNFNVAYAKKANKKIQLMDFTRHSFASFTLAFTYSLFL